ncbi:MAG: diguanylate cyclase, partial [Candidatus Hydrogenedentes bacterium]|nr:diguanylate cyclase [Candidatus Hydrogenedentota bacterium]
MKHNILLVDDIRSNVKLLERILEDLGHNLIAAYSGEEALKLAEQYELSVVLLDVRMPGLSGYEVAQRLRDMDASRHVPVIFVTAQAAGEAEVFDGYCAGGVDYLVKPIEPSIVRRKVQVFCELQAKEKQIQAQLCRMEEQKVQLEQQLDEMRVIEEAQMEGEMRYRSLVSLSPQAIVVEVNGELVFYNASAVQMLGSVEESAMCGRPFHTFVDEADRERVKVWMEEIARRGGRGEPLECLLQRHGADFAHRHIEMHACCILYNDDVGVQMAIQDITEHKLLEDKLRHLSRVDGLTGVWNRRCFDEQVKNEWSRLARNGRPLSLLMIDLDEFKCFNDTYGHLEGDACLRTVADVMKTICGRPADMVARYGGEEFIIILPDTDAAGARHIAANLVRAVEGANVRHEGNGEYGVVTISCGVATQYPSDDATLPRLLQA